MSTMVRIAQVMRDASRQFNGSSSMHNLQYKIDMQKQFDLNSVSHLQRAPLRPFIRPDDYTKTKRECDAEEAFMEDDEPMVDENDVCLTIDHPRVMTLFHLIRNAAGQIVVDPAFVAADVAAGEPVPQVPEPTWRWGDTPAARRTAYAAYLEEQKVLNLNHVKLTNDIAYAFTILECHCSEPARDLYKEFLPSPRVYGRVHLAWAEIERVISVMGVESGDTAMTTYQGLEMEFGDTIASYRHKMFKWEQVMDNAGVAYAGPIQNKVLESAICTWQCKENPAYARSFETMRAMVPPVTFPERINRLKAVESHLTSTYGHGSGSLIDHRAEAMRADIRRKAGGSSRRPEAHEAEVEMEAFAADEVYYCSKCRKEGHSIRDCPQCYFCTKCKWMHVKGSVCDNGEAKQTWLSIRDAKNKGASAGRGHGGRGAGRG